MHLQPPGRATARTRQPGDLPAVTPAPAGTPHASGDSASSSSSSSPEGRTTSGRGVRVGPPERKSQEDREMKHGPIGQVKRGREGDEAPDALAGHGPGKVRRARRVADSEAARQVDAACGKALRANDPRSAASALITFALKASRTDEVLQALGAELAHRLDLGQMDERRRADTWLGLMVGLNPRSSEIATEAQCLHAVAIVLRGMAGAIVAHEATTARHQALVQFVRAACDLISTQDDNPAFRLSYTWEDLFPLALRAAIQADGGPPASAALLRQVVRATLDQTLEGQAELDLLPNDLWDHCLLTNMIVEAAGAGTQVPELVLDVLLAEGARASSDRLGAVLRGVPGLPDARAAVLLKRILEAPNLSAAQRGKMAWGLVRPLGTFQGEIEIDEAVVQDLLAHDMRPQVAPTVDRLLTLSEQAGGGVRRRCALVHALLAALKEAMPALESNLAHIPECAEMQADLGRGLGHAITELAPRCTPGQMMALAHRYAGALGLTLTQREAGEQARRLLPPPASTRTGPVFEDGTRAARREAIEAGLGLTRTATLALTTQADLTDIERVDLLEAGGACLRPLTSEQFDAQLADYRGRELPASLRAAVLCRLLERSQWMISDAQFQAVRAALLADFTAQALAMARKDAKSRAPAASLDSEGSAASRDDQDEASLMYAALVTAQQHLLGAYEGLRRQRRVQALLAAAEETPGALRAPGEQRTQALAHCSFLRQELTALQAHTVLWHCIQGNLGQRLQDDLDALQAGLALPPAASSVTTMKVAASDR